MAVQPFVTTIVCVCHCASAKRAKLSRAAVMAAVRRRRDPVAPLLPSLGRDAMQPNNRILSDFILQILFSLWFSPAAGESFKKNGRKRSERGGAAAEEDGGKRNGKKNRVY